MTDAESSTVTTPKVGSDGRPAAGREPTPAAVLTLIGTACVVLGGLVAAVTGPLDLARGSWLAAYLVLVGGVAQFAMGHARSWLPAATQPHRWGWTQVGAWNLGNAAVIGGTLGAEPLMVDLGSVLLVAALLIALHAERTRAGATARSAAGPVPSLFVWGYRLLVMVLALSIPVGIVLSHVRHS